MEILNRTISHELLAMARDYPVVTIIGPRQSGKTTLVENVFSQKPYISLEDPDERMLAESDPRGFLDRFPDGAILDEIQRLPLLLSYIQGIVDKSNSKGIFILTGSHQLALHESITQSLAGRTAILKLLPLSIEELSHETLQFTLEDYIYHGLYPRVYKDNLDPHKFYRNYIQTYVERDLRQMIHIKDLTLFQHFLKLCAGRIGQLFNSQSLSNELGVSHSTIQNWLSILEASFLVFRLQPYFENLGKRLIKTPKLYFTDVGLACYLLDIKNPEQVFRDPLRGNLFENLVITEFMKYQYNRGIEPAFYFYRDSNQHEIDLLFKTGAYFTPIEIKSAKTFNKEFLDELKYFKKLTAGRCFTGTLIYGGNQEQKIGDYRVLNFKNFAQTLTIDQ